MRNDRANLSGMKLPRGASVKNTRSGPGLSRRPDADRHAGDAGRSFRALLIYVCAHSSEGAMGIVVNQPAPNINFPDLLVKLDVIPAAE